MTIISRIEIQNFKQFEHLAITCKDANIFVGPNNAGKSTILDALRLCADVLRYSKRKNPGISNFENFGVLASYTLEQSIVSIPLQNVTRNYTETPSRISITASNGNSMYLSVSANGPVKAYLNVSGNIPKSSTKFRKEFPLEIIVTPTLGPFESEERWLTDKTVQQNENTRLAARNFRNIMLRKSDDTFSEFKKLVESTWSNIEISKPEMNTQDNIINMFLMENRITREVNWTGFGFQIWMQLMLQMLRGKKESILVLDEPDIYLHADLQHKLLDIVKNRFHQFFIATHSTEIINEAKPKDIITISTESRTAKRVNSEESYNHLFGLLGSSENAEFARMARAKRIVFFEGKDKKIIRKLASKVSGTATLEDPDTIFVQSEGAANWKRVVGADWTIQKIFGMDVKIAAIFDRDYMSNDEVASFKSQIESKNVKCCVLERKEIENYFLSERALVKCVQNCIAKRGASVTESAIKQKLLSLTDEYEDDVLGNLTAKELSMSKKTHPHKDQSTIISEYNKLFKEKWSTIQGRFAIIPGKKYVSDLSRWLQQDYRASITLSQIADVMRKEDVPVDLALSLREINRFFELE